MTNIFDRSRISLLLGYAEGKQERKREKDAVTNEALRRKAKEQTISDLSEIASVVANANREQAEFSKALAIVSVIINTAQSISASSKIGFPQAIPAIAASAALGAVQIAAIQSTTIPTNVEGTEYVDREGRFPRGVDKVPSMLDRGEAVINRKSNSKYPGLAKAFNENEVDNWMDRNYWQPMIRVDNSNDFEDRNIVDSMNRNRGAIRETNRLLDRLNGTIKGSHRFRVN